MVPEPTFSAAAEVGDHVDFRASGDGWVGHVRRRTIRGQALYVVETQAAKDWLPVGEVERDGRSYTVFQAPDRPALVVESADRSPGRNTVTRLGRRSWTYNGQSYVRVLVERGNRSFVGDALEFPAGSLMRVRKTALRLQPHLGDGNPVYTVRRTFGLEAVIKQPSRPAASAEIEHNRWERALHDGNQHMVGSRDGDRLTLPGYRAPLPDGSFAGWLPIRPGELPLVDGHAYDNGCVRVLVEDVDDGHLVSFAQAVPLDVAGFSRRCPWRPTTSARPCRNRCTTSAPSPADTGSNGGSAGRWTCRTRHSRSTASRSGPAGSTMVTGSRPSGSPAMRRCRAGSDST